MNINGQDSIIHFLLLAYGPQVIEYVIISSFAVLIFVILIVKRGHDVGLIWFKYLTGG